jgi:hypothetical protein
MLAGPAGDVGEPAVGSVTGFGNCNSAALRANRFHFVLVDVAR